jgi:hypothetical protein
VIPRRIDELSAGAAEQRTCQHGWWISRIDAGLGQRFPRQIQTSGGCILVKVA